MASEIDYTRLLGFRDGLRRFLNWSEQQAREVGLTAAQHQLLLAIRGHGSAEAPTIGDVAEHLMLRHHSAVELVGRAESMGLVERRKDKVDHRVVRLRLSARGRSSLDALSTQHLDELRRLAPNMRPIWADLD
ncbi:helix-turn-helix domain-containing protein [soil metagenome]